MSSLRRIIAEITHDSKTWYDSEVNFWPNDPSDLYNCTAAIMGPKDSVYENGLFFLKVQYPQGYPFQPPKCTFITKIYNPCISSQGDISLDILEDQWTPANSVPKVLLSIQSLMLGFDIDSPLVPEIARQYTIDRNRYDSIAREWTELFAM